MTAWRTDRATAEGFRRSDGLRCLARIGTQLVPALTVSRSAGCRTEGSTQELSTIPSAGRATAPTLAWLTAWTAGASTRPI